MTEPVEPFKSEISLTEAEMQERAALERFAQAVHKKVLVSEADLDPNLRVMPEMLKWCEEQKDIVVLNGGIILTSDPVSRTVQNCKAILLAKKITPKEVLPATQELIQLLLSGAEHPEEKAPPSLLATETRQQARLKLLVKEALDADASDIHLEVREAGTKIRFRRNGEMVLHAIWTERAGQEVASVAFNRETDQGTVIFNPMIPQDASMPLEIDDRPIRLRLASLPAHGGFDMVMRILSMGTEGIATLEQLGYADDQIYIIKRAAKMSSGAILIAGPTGSGKTTTLASCLSMIPLSRKIYTIEDPVEKVVPNATQIPVNTEKEERGFANMGRAALRMDPDVIVFGEMRDQETAEVMVRATITGHLIFSTIHTNSAPGIVTRLADLGIPYYLLGDPTVLVCLMFQRLIPELCPQCSTAILDSPLPEYVELVKRWAAIYTGDWKKVKIRGKGCNFCRARGLIGRKVVAEVVWVDEQGRQFIQKGDTLGWEVYLKTHGWKDCRDNALALVEKGEVDPLDVEKMLGELNVDFMAKSFDYGKTHE